MATPLVSMMVPVYGVEAFIEKCARSLFEQTFEDIEYIFVNDCTPDNSMGVLKNVVEDYPLRAPHVHIIEHEKNSGIAAVRNTLLQHATGIYTIFIDSDDWIEKDMVETMYREISKADADIVGCDFYYSYPDREVYQHENYSTDKLTLYRQIISIDIHNFLHKLMVRRSLYVDNQITLVPGINVGEDYILHAKLFYYAQRVVSVPKALYHYVQYNQNSYSCSHTFNVRNIEDRMAAVQVVEDFCREKGVYPEVKDQINCRKFIIKTRFLLDDEYEDLDRWKNTFPEANSAWRLLSFRMDYKIIYWLAEHHFFRTVKLVKRLKKMMRRSG